MRTKDEVVKEQVKLLNTCKNTLMQEFNFDMSILTEAQELQNLTVAVYHETNKWLLSDKISSEKQARMDAYKQDKATPAEGGEDKPTKKQINYIIEHNGNPEGMGFTEAKEWIKNYISEHPFKEKK